MEGSINWLLGKSELGNTERNGDNGQCGSAVEEPGSNEVTGGEESIPNDAVKQTTHFKSHADTESTPPAPQAEQ